jgi:hypothetical protein
MGVVEANPGVILALIGNRRQTTNVIDVGRCNRHEGPVTNVA